MKSSNLLLIFSLFVGLLLGCSKEFSEENGNLPGMVGTPGNPGNPGNPGQVTGDFRAKINGEQWVANKVAGASRMNGFISLTGLSSQGKQLVITLTDSGAKTYKLNANAMNFAAYVDSTDANRNPYTTVESDQDSLAGGTLTITSIDDVNKKISGTFSFRVYRSQDGKKANFTEGKFTNISYGTTLPPASAKDTFRVKLNGNALVGSSIIVINTFGKINITFSDAGNTKNVSLSLDEAVTVGNAYTWSGFGDYMSIYNEGVTNPPVTYLGDGGNLTILEHNTTTKRIRGTFNFVANIFPIPVPPAKTFTEGYFSVKY